MVVTALNRALQAGLLAASYPLRVIAQPRPAVALSQASLRIYSTPAGAGRRAA